MRWSIRLDEGRQSVRSHEQTSFFQRPARPVAETRQFLANPRRCEAAAGGLFIPSEAGVRPGNFVTLPDQAVDNDGNISVPYAGIIKASGRTNVQVQADIISRIKNRAIEPQVLVALSSQRTSLVSVLGEVNNPVRFAAPASGAGDRITDALTRAGGIRGQGFETWVMLERGRKRGTVPFENLVMNASSAPAPRESHAT